MRISKQEKELLNDLAQGAVIVKSRPWGLDEPIYLEKNGESQQISPEIYHKLMFKGLCTGKVESPKRYAVSLSEKGKITIKKPKTKSKV